MAPNQDMKINHLHRKRNQSPDYIALLIDYLVYENENQLAGLSFFIKKQQILIKQILGFTPK